jgi:hypothetical protein
MPAADILNLCESHNRKLESDVSSFPNQFVHAASSLRKELPEKTYQTIFRITSYKVQLF